MKKTETSSKKSKISKPKKPVKKEQQKKTAEKPAKTKKEKYFEGLGRRKTAVARVRIFPQKETTFLVNSKLLPDYFKTKELQKIIFDPLVLMNCADQFKISCKVEGGGVVSQAEAIRHGIARALVLFNPNFRKKLKKAEYLKRDPRMRERKKFGLKRARRAPQWSKR